MANFILNIIEYCIVVLILMGIGTIVTWYPVRFTTLRSYLFMVVLKICVVMAASGPLIYIIRKFLIYINFLPSSGYDGLAWYLDNIFLRIIEGVIL